MIITDKVQIKVASLKESDKLRLTTSDELECYELIENDLKLPADATFTRSSAAYLSDGTQVAANTPRFEQGKFGKAIMVEEGTTNLLNNPTFEGESRLASCFEAYGAGVNYEIVNDGYLLNTLSQRLYYNSPTGNGSAGMNKGISLNITGQIGDVFTITFYGKGWDENGNIDIYNRSDTATYLSLKREQLEGGWAKYTYIIQLTDTETKCFIRPNNNKEYSFDCLINAPQAEVKPYPTSFTDSTRAAETLTIPTEGVLNPQKGTVEFWVYVDDVARRNIASNWSTVVLIRKGASVANWIWLFHDFNDTWVLQIRKEDGAITGWGGFNDSLTPDGWHYFAIRWNTQEGTAELFHNDVKRISLANVIFPVGYDRIEIGHRSGGLSDWLNSLIDDFRISNRARTDEEILAAYQSGQPLPVDEWTTYKLDFDFDDKVRITTQGQIICNELIEI